MLLIMKKHLHLFRARWLLIAITMLSVLGVQAQDTWYLFDSYLEDGQARATFTNPDADGNYVAVFDPTGSKGFNFVFVDSPNPNADRETATFLGAADNICNAADGVTSDLKLIDYEIAYHDQNVFVIDESIEVTFNPTAMTVKFARPMPRKLYLCDYTTSFAEAENDGSGVYRFENFVVTDNNYPHYGFTDNSNPRQASLVLGTVPYAEASKDNNMIVTSKGASGTWDFSDYECINSEIGSFEIPSGIAFDCVLDWNAKTVEFTKTEVKAPDVLYFVDFEKSYGSATNNGDGVYVFENVVPGCANYPYYGFSPEANPATAEWVLGTVDYTTASNGGAHAYNVNVEFGEEYTYDFSNAQAMYQEVGSFVLPNMAIDITLDWNKGTVVFTERPVPAPDNLWLVDYSAQYGVASNNGNGVFVFEGISVPDNGYPYYGFANNSNPRVADVIVSAVSASKADASNNVDVEFGGEYPVALTTWSNIDAMIGSYVIKAGTYDITLDWEAKTVRFDKPVIQAPAALYATDTYLEDNMGAASNNGTGVFEMVVNVDKSSALVVFTNSTDFKNTGGETLYYGTSDGPISNVEYGTEYGLGKSDYNIVWGDATGLRLKKGRYKLVVDFNEGTIVVHDISRGDVWVIPATLNMYNDEMGQVAQGNKVEDGVFQFDGVTIAEPTNVVFTDNPTSSGKFFGSSMNGDRSVKVKNFRTYDLYIPTYQEIYIDGLSGFEIPAGKWSVTVDMNEKTVSFEDPESAYYPEQLAAVVDMATTSNVAEGSSTYVWKLALAQESSLTFADPLTGRVYGSPAAGVAVAEGVEYEASELAADALNGYKVPAGTWEVVLDLEKGRIVFYEYVAISLVESTMKDGDKFYSYFGAGTNPDMTLTFNGNPYTVESAILALGDYTPGATKDTPTCTIEKITVYREGNTLFTSFAGKERSIPEGAQPKATFVVTSVKSVHGLLIETDAIEGLPAGSLMFTFDFEQFQPVTIESKLLDAAGQAVNAADTLNVDEMGDIAIMVKPYSLITFDGVALSPIDSADMDAVELEWEAGDADADGFTPIVAKLPMAIRGTGKWKLSLANLNADDLTEHGTEADFAIETLVHPADVLSANPENGSKVDELQDVTLTWNHALVQSVGYSGTVEPEVIVTDEAGNAYPALLQVLSTLGENELLIHLADRIVEAGNYTVVIPAGTIIVNDDKETNAKAIELAYQVSGSQSSIDKIIANNPDAEVVVCTVSGVILRQGRAADVLKDLRQGIYIINGVKTHIR